MARRIAAVGCVTVSLRRSTIPGRSFSDNARGDVTVSSLDWSAMNEADARLESLNSIRYRHQRGGFFAPACSTDESLKNFVGKQPSAPGKTNVSVPLFEEF